MKRYLVMCKDEQQWLDYLIKHQVLTEGSLITDMDDRHISFILHDKSSDDVIYYKVTPSTLLCQIPLGRMFDRIWLCEKEEFE